MSPAADKPRVGFLGTGAHELELLLELHAAGAAEVIGVYDADAHAPGLALAEVVGIPSGSDPAALERLRRADVIVLPGDRRALPDAVRWAGGLPVELVAIAEARRRWGSGSRPSASVPTPPPDGAAAAERMLHDAVDVSARLQDRSELADWLLGIAMRAAGANGGSIQLLAPDTAELYLVAARGLSERLVRFGRHRVGEGISGIVAATHAPQVLHGEKPGRLPRERGEISASISVPLEDESGLVGVLNVSSSVRGKRFGEATLRTLERLATRLARLLRDAQQSSTAPPGIDLPRLARRSEAENLGLEARLAALRDRACECLGADAAALYLATEGGVWLCVAAATSEPGRREVATARQKRLESAFVEQRWLHMPAPAAGRGGGEDPVEQAVERALDPSTQPRSNVYAPLVGLEPLGVLFLEFASLEAAERCLREGAASVQQLAFAIDVQVREHRERQRLELQAELARALQRLLEVPPGDELQTALAAEAARLVSGRHAFVRCVEEAQHTYSRPATFGVPAATLPEWRPLDARISEQTLHARQAILTTVADERDDAPEDAAARCSLLSVPVVHADHIVAIVNVYAKQPRDFLETNVFTRFDCDLLESFALVIGRLIAGPHPRGARPHLAAPATDATSEAGGEGGVTGRGPAPGGLRSAARLSVAADAAGAPDAVAAPAGAPSATEPAGSVSSEIELRDALEAELARAATERRGLGVWVLRFDGLARLGGEGEGARESLCGAVRRGLRASDRIEWTGAEELAILGPPSPPADPYLPDRLAALVRPQLARLGRLLDPGVELRIGASAFPEDGQDACGLLAAASERAR